MERSSEELYKVRDFIDKREQEKGSYSRQKKQVSWLLQGYLPLGLGSRRSSWCVPLWERDAHVEVRAHPLEASPPALGPRFLAA